MELVIPDDFFSYSNMLSHILFFIYYFKQYLFHFSNLNTSNIGKEYKYLKIIQDVLVLNRNSSITCNRTTLYQLILKSHPLSRYMVFKLNKKIIFSFKSRNLIQ